MKLSWTSRSAKSPLLFAVFRPLLADLPVDYRRLLRAENRCTVWLRDFANLARSILNIQILLIASRHLANSRLERLATRKRATESSAASGSAPILFLPRISLRLSSRTLFNAGIDRLGSNGIEWDGMESGRKGLRNLVIDSRFETAFEVFRFYGRSCDECLGNSPARPHPRSGIFQRGLVLL